MIISKIGSDEQTLSSKHRFDMYLFIFKSCMEMYTKKNVASRCINNRFRIKSLTSESESNQIVGCLEIPTPKVNRKVNPQSVFCSDSLPTGNKLLK